MKVYVLEGNIAWETSCVLGVYEDKKEANKRMEELEDGKADAEIEESKYDSYHVYEYTLIRKV